MRPTVRRVLRQSSRAVALTFVVGLALFFSVSIETVANLDRTVTIDLHTFALDHPPVPELARIITWLGNPVVLTTLVIAAAGGLLRGSHRNQAMWLVVVTGLGAITETALKLTIRRSRPDLDTALLNAHGTSFPSGHAMNTIIVLGAVALALPIAEHRQRQLLLLVAMSGALFVGATRVLVGVHYLSDVASGYLLGLLWLMAMRPCPHETPEMAADIPL